MKNKIKRFMTQKIEIERQACYFYLLFCIILFAMVMVIRHEGRYIYGVNDENRISTKCYAKKDGLYCIDEIKVDWYYNAE